MTEPYVVLDPFQALPERSFTDTVHIAQDMAHLRNIADCLRHVLADLPDEATASAPYVFRHYHADGSWCRVVVCQTAALKRPQALAAVGFFGQKRPAPETLAKEINRLDEELLEEFLQHPLIVAYCTQQLPDGNFGNLVLMSHLEAKRQWEGNERHRYAALELAPHYYFSVRLHNFELPDGVDGAVLHLQRTKYYDYAQPTVWRGVREQTPPAQFAFR